MPLRKYKIHDTTLRDGEQMPGVCFTPQQKLEIAKAAADFGVDEIDVMPVVSPSEKKIVAEIVKANFGPEISASCRIKNEDIDIARQCDVKKVTLFSPLSDIHLQYKLRINKEENLRRTLKAVDYAKAHGLRINFAAEDATRADFNYLVSFIKELGRYVEVFFIADTLGHSTPKKFYDMIRDVKKISSWDIGVHVHNDFGLATANTLAALKAGANVFSGTFCGIGERAGNAPIEEVCVALKYLYGIDLGVKYDKLTSICELVQSYSKIILQAHKPIVGKNAFSHESGIHADGVIKNPRTYENFDPAEVGQKRCFVFGKHSGRAIIEHVLGVVSKRELNRILNKIKAISESGGGPLYGSDVINIARK